MPSLSNTVAILWIMVAVVAFSFYVGVFDWSKNPSCIITKCV